MTQRARNRRHGTNRRASPAPAAAASANHLLGLHGLSPDVIRSYLQLAREYSAARTVKPVLAGKIIANLFFEDSTRTRTSFSIAAMRLGAQVVDLMGAGSSVNKGETLIDTATNVEAMGVAAVVVRAKQSGAAAMVAQRVRCAVINGGDGRHEHPTQGLLDVYTIAESMNRLRTFDLSGLKFAIVGDIVSSRVARSTIAALNALGASVICVGPPSMAPGSLAAMGVTIRRDMDAVVPDMDAVMMLRIQFERAEAAAGTKGESLVTKAPGLASVREYRAKYSLTQERADTMKAGAIVLHPGPINRGIELDAPVADGPRSVILRQVTNGVLVRMAVMAKLCGRVG
ncbi:MAG: aspartate carbamoyltransferase catalytic subunit [Planctomycetota bacterium]|nr:aspartate carbamoyltransferase catalytic subunit [Planctomycetota bacterium]